MDCDGVSAGVQTGTPEEIREFVRKKKQAGDCGVEPMAALIPANSLGAESMGLADQIGSMPLAWRRNTAGAGIPVFADQP